MGSIVPLTSCLTGLESAVWQMTIFNFCFYLQNRLIQTSQTGGQLYSDTSLLDLPEPSHLSMLHLKSLNACQGAANTSLKLQKVSNNVKSFEASLPGMEPLWRNLFEKWHLLFLKLFSLSSYSKIIIGFYFFSRIRVIFNTIFFFVTYEWAQYDRVFVPGKPFQPNL